MAVEPPSPRDMACGVVFLRPLALEHRFRSPVTLLLFPVRSHRVAVVVPDHSSGAEAKRSTAFLQTPADIDVVTGGSKLRIESTNRVEIHFPKRHIATRNVFRLVV